MPPAVENVQCFKDIAFVKRAAPVAPAPPKCRLQPAADLLDNDVYANVN